MEAEPVISRCRGLDGCGGGGRIDGRPLNLRRHLHEYRLLFTLT